MNRIKISVIGSLTTLVAYGAIAEPVFLSCRLVGGDQQLSLQVTFDEAAHTLTTNDKTPSEFSINPAMITFMDYAGTSRAITTIDRATGVIVVYDTLTKTDVFAGLCKKVDVARRAF